LILTTTAMQSERPEITQAQRQLLSRGIEYCGLDISAEALSAIELHLSLVQKWRHRINLISIANDLELITHHALDSLVLLPFIEQSQRVLDFGTGAGFPGLQLAGARPDIAFSLLDSRQRRIEFLRMVSAQAGLGNTTFINSRIEDLSVSEELKELPHSDVHTPAKFDTLVVRAVAPLEQLVLLTAPLRVSGQRLIAMKGQYPHAELEALKNKYADQIVSVQVEPLDVPFLKAERHAVVIEY
jgi:16S rRNA (guanine527-N7)-methyltransferase